MIDVSYSLNTINNVTFGLAILYLICFSYLELDKYSSDSLTWNEIRTITTDAHKCQGYSVSDSTDCFYCDFSAVTVQTCLENTDFETIQMCFSDNEGMVE